MGSNEKRMLEKYDAVYSTYTSDLDDVRLPLFIKALVDKKPISFQLRIYYIMRILLTAEKTIIVLKAVQ